MTKQERKVFVSTNGFQSARMQAIASGYIVIGERVNPRGEYVVFARKGGPSAWKI